MLQHFDLLWYIDLSLQGILTKIIPETIGIEGSYFIKITVVTKGIITAINS